jgi:hypothetical protein
MAQDPITRLQFARVEIDRVFGAGYAAAHSEVVTAVMLCATADHATHWIANALEFVGTALLEPENNDAGIVRASELLVRSAAR